ncbi:MAG: hypothetical protein FDZ75_05215 [Actinobacteria bacterium]|nr:MAG: hypothetical protein FDZ75_05215 [Actinomycetota bacterium]
MQLRYPWGILGLFVLQAVARGHGALRQLPSHAGVVIWAGACLLLAFLLWQSRDLPGVGLVAGGVAANVLVVLANGAMPVHIETGLTVSTGFYAPLGGADLLQWMADILPVPGGYLASLGDMLMIVGIAVLVGASSIPRETRRLSQN